MAHAAHHVRLLAGLAHKKAVNHIPRHPISFLLTFYLLPIAVLSLLLALPKFISTQQVSGAADAAPIKSLADTVRRKLVIVHPDSLGNHVPRVITNFTKSINPDMIQIVKSDAEMFDACESGLCHAAVTFYNSPETTTSENRTCKYAIRSDATSGSTADYLARKSYADDVLMPLQLAINNAITNSSTVPETFMLARTKSSVEATRKDDAVTFIGSIFTFASLDASS